MSKKQSNSYPEYEDIGDFDFFDFSDVDPVDIKKGSVAANLSALMVYSNISQSQLAKKLKWKASRLSKVLSGQQNLTLKTISDITFALEYDFELCFHKPNETLTVQPWEKKLNALEVHEPKKTQHYLIWQVQTPQQVEHDIQSENTKDFYISCTSFNKDVTPNLSRAKPVLIEQPQDQFKDIFSWKDCYLSEKFENV